MPEIQKRFSFELQNNIILHSNEEIFYGDTEAKQIGEDMLKRSDQVAGGIMQTEDVTQEIGDEIEVETD